MSVHVTPHELQVAARALMGVHRETGVDAVKTAGTLGAQGAGNAAVADALGDVCERIEFGASAFMGVISMMTLALAHCGDDFTLADVKSGKVIEEIGTSTGGRAGHEQRAYEPHRASRASSCRPARRISSTTPPTACVAVRTRSPTTSARSPAPSRSSATGPARRGSACRSRCSEQRDQVNHFRHGATHAATALRRYADALRTNKHAIKRIVVDAEAAQDRDHDGA